MEACLAAFGPLPPDKIPALPASSARSYPPAMNWSEFGWALGYGAVALSFWLVLASAARTKQIRGMTEKEHPSLFGLTMIAKGILAMAFSLIALVKFAKAILPALSQ